MTALYNHSWLYNLATGMASWANILPSFVLNNGLNPWAEGHKMMKFPKKPFHELIKELDK